MTLPALHASRQLDDVKYEIRGPLARRAVDLEKAGYEIIKLNIGNPGAFGFRTPETMRLAVIENLGNSEAYCAASKGIFPAREAVVMQQQERGVMDVGHDDVSIGNGVSEMIMMCMRGLLNDGDEVLVPSPDYPLWTASVVIHGGKVVHYPCLPSHHYIPQPRDIEKLITDRTRAIVLINPNNPTGAVYPKSVLQEIVALAEEKHLVIFSDEIYGDMCYDDQEFHPLAPMVKHTLCGTFSGLSKIYRACGYRVGWVSFNGEKSHAHEYLLGLDLLASLRLCGNVPGQWAVQTALGGFQSVHKLVSSGGRLFETRRVVLQEVAKSPYLNLVAPAGAIYAFIGVNTEALPDFDDEQFALDLLERKHVLIAPGSSFNVPYRDHFRITLLPDPELMVEVFERMASLFDEYAEA